MNKKSYVKDSTKNNLEFFVEEDIKLISPYQTEGSPYFQVWGGIRFLFLKIRVIIRIILGNLIQ
ncbi:MAG: hypothetical protein K6T88_00245 [Bacillus sp. (in: Bacteria)]|nr:hypothetical protein [Bacillus sp. (in: firmicutes)]